MTTIIGIQKEDHALLIADSRVTDGNGRTYSHPVATKITKNGAFLIAGAGATQPCDIIQHIWKAPSKSPKKLKDIYRYMISEVVPSMRIALTTNGYIHDKDNEFLFLMVIGGYIFELDETLSVLMREDGIYGIGSGAAYAIGALHAGADLKKAIQIASINDVYTSAPFTTKRQYQK
jgi:ATP-dependent protease HslVU (ClpYQ) peptidase subunit